MIQAVIFFLVSFCFGRALIKLSRIEVAELHTTVSIVLGAVVICLVLFLGGLVLPFNLWTVSIELVILTVISLSYLRYDFRQVFYEVKRGLFKKSFTEILFWLFFLLFVAWFFNRALFLGKDGSIIAGDRLVWTDWPVHIGLSANFAYGRNFPPQNPTFAGIPLIYPFFADFLSGILLVLGANYPAAFNLPGIILIGCFFSLFIGIASQFLVSDKSLKSSQLTGFLALYLSLFWGGMGFVYYFKELFENETQFVARLLAPPREYTFWSEKGLWFFTFLYSEILPQRAFLFGLPLFFLVLLLLYIGWQKGIKPNFLVAGILAGLLPFFHTHTFVAVWILSLAAFGFGGIYIWLKNSSIEVRRKYLEAIFLYFLPMGGLTFLQMPLFQSQFSGLPWEFGWMKGKENFLVFWFKNTGFFLPLMFLALWKGKFNPLARFLGICSFVLFIIPNLFRFAPWGYDNLKIFTYWYLLGSIFVAVYLIQIAKGMRIWGALVAVWLIFTLTLSGMIEVSRLADTNTKKIGLWSKLDQEFARELRGQTLPGAVFLAAAIHDHPVVTLAGRKILLGFPGNSWSWGIKGWEERERDIHTMYQGGDKAKELWKKYKIDYIVVGSREHYFEKNIDEVFIKANTQLFLEKADERVYKIIQ